MINNCFDCQHHYVHKSHGEYWLMCENKLRPADKTDYDNIIPIEINKKSIPPDWCPINNNMTEGKKTQIDIDSITDKLKHIETGISQLNKKFNELFQMINIISLEIENNKHKELNDD